MRSSTVWKSRWLKLVKKIKRIYSVKDRKHFIEVLSNPEKPLILAFANAHAMNLLVESKEFFDSLIAADTILRDGSGMETLFHQLNICPGLNLNGTDLIPDVVSQFNGRPIAIFGTEDPYLKSGAEFIKSNLAPQSSCLRTNGFLDDHTYVSEAFKYRPALIVLGMGMPRQEEVAIALRSRLTHPCLIICGGAIIDFWGGRTSRAPLWMRQNGMEWLFRLQKEPRRLFRRYVTGNLVFLMRVLTFSIFKKRLNLQELKK